MHIESMKDFSMLLKPSEKLPSSLGSVPDGGQTEVSHMVYSTPPHFLHP